MPDALSTSDLRLMLEGVASLYGAQGSRDLASRIITVVGGICRANVLHYNEIDLSRKLTLKIALNENDGTDPLIETFSAFVDHHPIIQAIASSGDGSPRTFSDIISRGDWGENPLHREFFAAAGCRDHDQMAFALPGFDPKRWIVGVAINRKWGQISERDRTIVKLLYPHITQAYLNARRADMHADTLEALQQSDSSAIALTPHGQILWQTRRAASQLRDYFPRHQTSALPDKLLAWVRPKLATLFRAGGATPVPVSAWTPFRVTGPSGVLSIRACAQPEGILLLFTERLYPGAASAADPRGALPPDLTPRQLEIIHFLCDGLAEKDIARELRLARTTVHTYITDLYRAVGVTSRGELLSRFIRRPDR